MKKLLMITASMMGLGLVAPAALKAESYEEKYQKQVAKEEYVET